MNPDFLRIAWQVGLSPEVLLSTLAAFGIFGFGGGNKGSQDDTPIDPQTLAAQLKNRIEDLSDADRRGLGFSAVDPSQISIEAMQLGAEMAEKLSKKGR